MVKLVNIIDLGSIGEILVGSNPTTRNFLVSNLTEIQLTESN